jgi:hypothetical protein
MTMEHGQVRKVKEATVQMRVKELLENPPPGLLKVVVWKSDSVLPVHLHVFVAIPAWGMGPWALEPFS